MDLSNISKVIECLSDDTANQYLNAGWKLLYVGQLNNGETSCTAFVVGWSSELGEPIKPKSTCPNLCDN